MNQTNTREMSMGIVGKYNKIRHIVRIRQMLQQWRRKAAISSARRTGVPADVPAGHVAICVGNSCTRFVVRTTYLNHPIFKKLLAQAEEEYGFAHQGPLAIPCNESLFEEILRFISRAGSRNSAARSVKVDEFQRCCLVGYHHGLDVFGDSRPLLREYTGKPVC